MAYEVQDNTGLAIGTGIAKGLDNAVQNFVSIKKSMANIKMEEENHNLNKKMKKLKLQRFEELDMDPAVLKAEKERDNLANKQAEMNIAISKSKLKQQSFTTKQEVFAYKKELEGWEMFRDARSRYESGELGARESLDSSGKWSVGATSKASGQFTQNQIFKQEQALNKALNMIKSKSKVNKYAGTSRITSERDMMASLYEDKDLDVSNPGIQKALDVAYGRSTMGRADTSSVNEQYTQKIKELREGGMSDDEIASLLKEAGLNPEELMNV